MGFDGYDWEGFKRGITKRISITNTIITATPLLKNITFLTDVAFLLGGGGKAPRTETVITDTEVLLGGGGKAPRTEIVITDTEVLLGGGGKAPRTETVLIGTTVLASGSL